VSAWRDVFKALFHLMLHLERFRKSTHPPNATRLYVATNGHRFHLFGKCRIFQPTRPHTPHQTWGDAVNATHLARFKFPPPAFYWSPIPPILPRQYRAGTQEEVEQSYFFR
jgi:hypothetical protein